MDRILSTNYIPDIEDILFIRKPTASVQEHLFTSAGNVYKVIDVAGQRSQRHKWISLFEGVTAIVFITSLTSYSEGTYEDSSLNSLHDSLSAFGSVITNQCLKNTNFILLLNKKDLLAKRLSDVPFSSIIENYKGRNEEDDVIEYIKKEFEKRITNNKRVQFHVCSAIDTVGMKPLAEEIVQSLCKK